MSTCENDGDAISHPEQIRALYTALAETPDKDFGWGKGRANARSLGYTDEWLERLPDSVWESAAAVGNPFSVSPIGNGQIVVDLGCGAGADACVAALLVGEEGRVIGVDCTSAMITKARVNAATAGFARIELHEADMTRLPIADGCADVVISNGAINLSTDKECVLAEAYRVLRPGGRLQIADMVKDPSAEEEACCAGKESWADCVSGTLDPDAFIVLMEQAGFSNVELIAYTGYRTAAHTVGALFSAERSAPKAKRPIRQPGIRRMPSGSMTDQCTFSWIGMKMTHNYKVTALWDDEAAVWVATSEDVTGLITEAETVEQLEAKLAVMIPELLDENGM